LGSQEFLYVETGEAITGLGYLCIVDSGYVAEMADSVSSAPGAGFGMKLGAAQAAIESGGFGWIQTCGRGTIRTLASTAKGTQLTISATPGAVDDATTSGLEVAGGISLGTASGGAPEANADAYFTFPTASRTL